MERSCICNIYDINNNNNNNNNNNKTNQVLNIMRHLRNDGNSESTNGINGIQKNKNNNINNDNDDHQSTSKFIDISDNINDKINFFKPIRKMIKRQESHEECPDSDDDDDDDNNNILHNERSIICNTITNKIEKNHENQINSIEEETDNYETNSLSPTSRRRRRRIGFLIRDNSLHSDSSLYSSVDSLLEARKPDPEAILINLGFGPVKSDDILSRIPKRFLKPSQVKGIDTDAFIRRLQLASNLHDNSVLGYRGLTGNPDVPPSTIVAKIMERFEVNQRKKSMGSIEQIL